MMAPGPGGTKLSLQEMRPPALALMTSAAVGLLGQVKMAGAVLPTVKVTGAVAMPWYSTCICVLLLIPYGAMALTCLS